jgi:hypothetical protein
LSSPVDFVSTRIRKMLQPLSNPAWDEPRERDEGLQSDENHES